MLLSWLRLAKPISQPWVHRRAKQRLLILCYLPAHHRAPKISLKFKKFSTQFLKATYYLNACYFIKLFQYLSHYKNKLKLHFKNQIQSPCRSFLRLKKSSHEYIVKRCCGENTSAKRRRSWRKHSSTWTDASPVLKYRFQRVNTHLATLTLARLQF